MSLLNEALRKKERNSHRTRNADLFRSRPKAPGLKRIWVYASIVGLIVLGGLFFAGEWFTYLLSEFTQSQQITDSQKLHPESPIAAESSASAEETQLKTSKVAEQKTIIPGLSKEHHPGNGIIQKKIPSEIVSEQPSVSTKQPNPATTPSGQNRESAGQKDAHPLSEVKAPNPFYEKALLYHRQNNIPEAIRMYQQVIMRDPEHNGAMFNLAAAYMASARFEEAYPLMKKLRARDPENPHILLNLAISKIALGKPQEAVSMLSPVENQNGQYPFELYFSLGAAFSRLEQFEEAIQWYKKAAVLQPNHPLIFFNMGVLYDRLQDYPNAIRYYVAFLNENVASSPREKRDVADRIRTLKTYLAEQAE